MHGPMPHGAWGKGGSDRENEILDLMLLMPNSVFHSDQQNVTSMGRNHVKMMSPSTRAMSTPPAAGSLSDVQAQVTTEGSF